MNSFSFSRVPELTQLRCSCQLLSNALLETTPLCKYFQYVKNIGYCPFGIFKQIPSDGEKSVNCPIPDEVKNEQPEPLKQQKLHLDKCDCILEVFTEASVSALQWQWQISRYPPEGAHTVRCKSIFHGLKLMRAFRRVINEFRHIFSTFECIPGCKLVYLGTFMQIFFP